MAQCNLCSLLEDLMVTCAWCGLFVLSFLSSLVVVAVFEAGVVVVLCALASVVDIFLKVALNFFQSSSFSFGVAFLQSIKRCGPAHFRHFRGWQKCFVLLAWTWLLLSFECLLFLTLCCWFRDDCRYFPRVFSC